MAFSPYAPIWAQLKLKGKVKVAFDLPEGATSEQLRKECKTIRKAISDLKYADETFTTKHPEARLESKERDTENGTMVLELKYTNIPRLIEV